MEGGSTFRVAAFALLPLFFYELVFGGFLLEGVPGGVALELRISLHRLPLFVDGHFPIFLKFYTLALHPDQLK